MIRTALTAGFRSATRRPGLVALLWAWNLALAVPAALPFWRWAAGVSGVSPETDVLLDGADVGLITQLFVADSRMLPALMAAVAGTAAVSLLSGSLLAGGLLEVLMCDGDERPLLHRFFHGAGRFFGRFLRLLLAAGIALAVSVATVWGALRAVRRPLAVEGAEAYAFWSGVGTCVAIGLVVAFFMLALDYARVFTVAGDEREMLRAFGRGMRLVVRHPLTVISIGLVAGIGVATTVAACAAYDVAFSARSWGVIAGAILLQQAMAFARTAVRVGQVAAQARFACAVWSPLPEGPADTEPDVVDFGGENVPGDPAQRGDLP